LRMPFTFQVAIFIGRVRDNTLLNCD
jgi:hypothetical protein